MCTCISHYTPCYTRLNIYKLHRGFKKSSADFLTFYRLLVVCRISHYSPVCFKKFGKFYYNHSHIDDDTFEKVGNLKQLTHLKLLLTQPQF